MMWVLLLVAGLAALLLTGALRRYALANSLIDTPNARSSHTVPTPRGGGVAIVISFCVMLPVFAFMGVIDGAMTLALLGAGIGIAVLGFLDDHGHIAARWRLLGHVLGSVWALFWLGGLPAVTVFGASIDLVWLGHIGAVLYLVWMLNLYNFMDGIDGLASVEAITACLSIVLIYSLCGFADLIWAPALLAVTVAGFLCWNFPPAKIFMGDAGSGFLGITLGILSLQASWASFNLFWAWIILLGVFIVDATFTLIRRLVRGDKVYEAHRSHGYQFASRRYGKHLPVTLAVAVINVCWLLPIALCVTLLGLDGLLGVLLAYLPLILLAVKFQAGQLEVAKH